MNFDNILRFILLLSVGFVLSQCPLESEVAAVEGGSAPIAEASNEGLTAMKSIQLPPGFEIDLWASEPQLANPVAIHIDRYGKIYVAETYRHRHGVEDNRQHMYWMDEEMASRTVEDRIRMYRKWADLGKLPMDWFTARQDRISILEDSNHDGRADRNTVFATFNGIADGIGAGITERNGLVYFAEIPNIWLLKDGDGDGVADMRESLSYGYGVKVSLSGHDMHGFAWGPDGKLYWSIGDRSYHVETPDGRVLEDAYSGAVFRSNPNGSELEVFATGLRNPQELAFDDYGNLFSVDNDADGKDDTARVVYITEGSDAGWRMSYQYMGGVNAFDDYGHGPWHAEKIWHLPWDGQPAYIVPPIGHVSDGPSGLLYNPGVGLPAKYKGYFFICDFRGDRSNSGVHAFTVQPDGAGFTVLDEHPFIWNVLPTDIDIGYDGHLYLTDWVAGWIGEGKGRIYRIHHPEAVQNPLVAEVEDLFRGRWMKRSVKKLVALLKHEDKRVRLEAQYTLASIGNYAVDSLVRTAIRGDHQLARIHALWALSLVERGGIGCLDEVKSLLSDSDPEIRAQAAKVFLGARDQSVFDALILLTTDDSTRVRFFAAMALGKLGREEAVDAISDMLEQNRDQDRFLRHAGIMALYWIAEAGESAWLEPMSESESPAVRLASLLVMRRLKDERIARFLTDEDPFLVAEAARAVNDVPLLGAQADLALLIKKTGVEDSNLLRRILNANFRNGETENAEALAAFASRADAPANMRAEALHCLADWTTPQPRDRVMGMWRPLPERSAKVVRAAVKPVIEDLLKNAPSVVRSAALTVAAKYGVEESRDVLFELSENLQISVAERVEVIRTLGLMEDDRLIQVVENSRADKTPEIRAAGNHLLTLLNPEEGVENLGEVLISDSTLIEKQAAHGSLGAMADPSASRLVAAEMKRFFNGELPVEIHLDLLSAAGAHKDRGHSELAGQLDRYQLSLDPDDSLASHRISMKGGNSSKGRNIFFNKIEVQCIRCHRIGGEGSSEVAPDLTGIGERRDREYILESIVAPNAQSAEGFETSLIVLKDGTQYSGIVREDNEFSLKLEVTIEAEDEEALLSDLGTDPQIELIEIDPATIEERRTGLSGMPEGLSDFLSPEELRDLVEFIAGSRAG